MVYGQTENGFNGFFIWLSDGDGLKLMFKFIKITKDENVHFIGFWETIAAHGCVVECIFLSWFY